MCRPTAPSLPHRQPSASIARPAAPICLRYLYAPAISLPRHHEAQHRTACPKPSSAPALQDNSCLLVTSDAGEALHAFSHRPTLRQQASKAVTLARVGQSCTYRGRISCVSARSRYSIDCHTTKSAPAPHSSPPCQGNGPHPHTTHRLAAVQTTTMYPPYLCYLPTHPHASRQVAQQKPWAFPPAHP
jgi:hypothetical protein